MIRLGDKVKEVISGFEGIVVAKTEWLNGCIRISIQPQGLHEGGVISSETFDEEQIELIESGAVKLPRQEQEAKSEGAGLKRTGGDRPSISRGDETPDRR